MIGFLNIQVAPFLIEIIKYPKKVSEMPTPVQNSWSS